MNIKLISLIALILFVGIVNAQENLDDIYEKIKNGKFIEAQSSIEKIIKKESEKDSPRAWLYKGAIYQLIHENEQQK